jgi:hypothetical protein
MKTPPTGVIDSDDPWIAGYLKLRHAVLTGELDTQDEIAAYAAELRRDLPDPLHHIHSGIHRRGHQDHIPAADGSAMDTVTPVNPSTVAADPTRRSDKGTYRCRISTRRTAWFLAALNMITTVVCPRAPG